MSKAFFSSLILMCFLFSCKKDKPKEITDGEIKQVTETLNGITYKIFTAKNAISYQGILAVGSGNNEQDPAEGAIDGAAETALCKKAAANGYAAAIVRYQKPASGTDWNNRAKLIGVDFDRCIVAISTKYGIAKNKSVVGGFSYAAFMLFTDISLNPTLSYTKGVLGACGASGAWNAQHFKVPIFAINCSGNNEGDFNGRALYDQIPASLPIKAKSAGITDPNCHTHCGGSWTNQMYDQMVAWLQ